MDDDELDIYADLDEPKDETKSGTKEQQKESSDLLALNDVSIIEEKLNQINQQNSKLIKDNEMLKEKLANCEQQNKVLRTNISSLYKTAKAEIMRKKREIQELRMELDDLIFKRNLRSANDSKGQMTMDKWTMTMPKDIECHCESQGSHQTKKESKSFSSTNSSSSRKYESSKRHSNHRSNHDSNHNQNSRKRGTIYSDESSSTSKRIKR